MKKADITLHSLRLILITLVCLMTLVLKGQFMISEASRFTEYGDAKFQDHFLGKTVYLPPVNIVVKGTDLLSDTPGIIKDSRTLVPISSIFNMLEIPYTWVPQTRQINFETAGKKVTLQIDNPISIVDGIPTNLPDNVAPRVLTYYDDQTINGITRTYVPLRFVSEVLGYEVNWIANSSTVMISRPSAKLERVYVDYLKDYPEVRMKVSMEVDFNTYSIDGKDVGSDDSIIVDIQNTKLENTQIERVTDQIFGIKNIFATQTSSGSVRVTINKTQRKGYDVYFDQGTNEVVLRLINTVSGFEATKMYSTDTLILTTSEDVKINQFIDGNKLTVDIVDAFLSANSGTFNINQGKIKTLTLSELSPQQVKHTGYFTDLINSGKRKSEGVVTRFEITFDQNITYDDIYIETEKNLVYIYIVEDILSDFSYTKISDSSSQITINTKEKFTNQVQYDPATRNLTINIPKNIATLELFDYQPNDNLASRIRIFDAGQSNTLTITLDENTNYTASINNTSINISLTNTVIENSKFRDTLIVIDAGHGGRDPGAIGKRTQEKVIALKTAQKLADELKKLGFKVYMIRTDDTYFGLYDRAGIANSLGADLFISVHYNASTNKSVTGLEVLYSNNTEKKLASAIQKNLVFTLGGKDRGIKHTPNIVVLRETHMPSVLLELGFISSEIEELKIMSEQYQIDAARATAKAIESYLKESN